MMATLSVEVKSEFVTVDPDGSACFGCGEQCDAVQYQLQMTCNNEQPEFGETVLCVSCYEQVKASVK